MHSIGLTGGIGSGKSTVARMLLEIGAPLIDADAISRQATQAGGVAISVIEQTFGSAFITPEQFLDRNAMRELIAREPLAKSKLEAIIHPIVGQEITRQRTAAKQAGAKLVVIDIPLLAEGGSRWRSQLDAIWVVDCLPETQIARVQARSGWPREQVEAMIAAQASRAQRLACADAVIFNEALSFDELRTKVSQMAQALL
jgi:dephospho-CoA kinase